MPTAPARAAAVQPPPARLADVAVRPAPVATGVALARAQALGVAGGMRRRCDDISVALRGHAALRAGGAVPVRRARAGPGPQTPVVAHPMAVAGRPGGALGALDVAAQPRIPRDADAELPLGPAEGAHLVTAGAVPPAPTHVALQPIPIAACRVRRAFANGHRRGRTHVPRGVARAVPPAAGRVPGHVVPGAAQRAVQPHVALVACARPVALGAGAAQPVPGAEAAADRRARHGAVRGRVALLAQAPPILRVAAPVPRAVAAEAAGHARVLLVAHALARAVPAVEARAVAVADAGLARAHARARLPPEPDGAEQRRALLPGLVAGLAAEPAGA